jgi:hypothetical protein
LAGRIVTVVTAAFGHARTEIFSAPYIFEVFHCPFFLEHRLDSSLEDSQETCIFVFLKSFDGARESRTTPKRYPSDRSQTRQSGQTIFIVAVALVVVLGMAALAVDVTFFYAAHSQAQKAADAAALAGAKAFVSSGFTSGQLGDPASGGAQAFVCNGSSGLADIQALAVARQNKIASGLATNFTTICNFSTPGNPQITVTISRSNLPIFFGRVWGGGGVQVSATAKAEAYNPSGQTVPIEVGSVKPWLITNCDYTNQNPALLNPNCPLQLNAGGISIGADYFIDPHNDYAIANNGSFIGKPFRLQQVTVLGAALPTGILNSFYPLIIPITAGSASCPSAGAPSCNQVDAAAPGYYENVACANSVRLQCGPAQAQGGLPRRRRRSVEYSAACSTKFRPGRHVPHTRRRDGHQPGTGHLQLAWPGIAGED